MRRLMCALVLLLWPVAAPAKWMEASSNHFVVYANDRPENLKQFSEQLERFDSALALVLGAKGKIPSPSNRVTIYVVRDDREVRRLSGDGDQNVYAFYTPRAGGSIAIVPRVEAGNGKQLDFSMIALLHEYTHHVTLSLSPFPMPRWFVEGSAEFFSSAAFEKDGAVNLGQPAVHRGPELFYAADVTAMDLLDPDQYEKRRARTGGSDAYYGKAWLLYHYLVFSPQRSGQTSAYLRALSSGKSPKEAAIAAFGDISGLEKELDRYLNNSRMMMLHVPPENVATGPVTMRELSEGEAAMMPVRVRSKRGVTREQAKVLLTEARSIAARYPEDPAVLSALAEAEYDAGNDDAAIAAADKALARDAGQVNAYVQKGYALFREAESADDKIAAYRTAIAPFQALNKIEPDHPLPLLYYYMSFTQRGATPSKLAVDALGKAVDLAPFDLDLRAMVAFQEIRDKKIPEAIADLQPIAYNPHGGDNAERYRELLDTLKAGDLAQATLVMNGLEGGPDQDRNGGRGEASRGAIEGTGKEAARETPGSGSSEGGKAAGKAAPVSRPTD
ncbi:MAG: hypothetical protein J7494_08940 [Sphingobium sp.]|nr:hypothetical protein [Sphingobium sp.]